MKWNTLSLAGHFLSLVLLAMLTAGTEAQTGFGESTTAQTATSTSSTIARLTASDGLPGMRWVFRSVSVVTPSWLVRTVCESATIQTVM